MTVTYLYCQNSTHFITMTVRFSKICKCTFFFDNFQNKSLIRSNVANYLTDLGIVPVSYNENSSDNNQVDVTTSTEKPKKGCCKKKPKEPRKINKSIALEIMPKRIAVLRTGQVVKVPSQLHELCNFVLRNAEVKGIFKKPGSAAKQEDIKNLLSKGEHLPPENVDVVDVAQVILQFLTELPVSIIPPYQHRFFLTCYDHPDREDVLTIACLLLPPNHVNLLTYLMQFFEQISTHHKLNKMTVVSLGSCIGPVLMPVNAPEDVKKTAEIMSIFIRRADLIGMVPEIMTEGSDRKRKPLSRKLHWMGSILKKSSK